MENSDQYELAPQPPKPKPAPARPIPHAAATPAASDLDVEKLTKQTVPACILGGGLVVELVATLIRSRSNPGSTLIGQILGVAVTVLLMMAGLLITARVRQIKLGSPGSAALRLAAAVIGPMALGDLLSPAVAWIPFGGFAAAIGQFVLFFVLLGMFFDLDESDTWYCLAVVFVISVAVHLGWAYLIK
jgi:hypothetical protein